MWLKNLFYHGKQNVPYIKMKNRSFKKYFIFHQQEHVTPPKIEIKRDFMSVLVTCKNKADLKNTEAKWV